MESPNLGKTALQKALDVESESSDFEVVQKNEEGLVEGAQQIKDNLHDMHVEPELDYSNADHELPEFKSSDLGIGGFGIEHDDTFLTAHNTSAKSNLDFEFQAVAPPTSQMASSANFISAEIGEVFSPKSKVEEPAVNFGAGGDDDFLISVDDSLEKTMVINPDIAKPVVEIPSLIDIGEPEIPVRVESKPAPVEPKHAPIEPKPAPAEAKPAPVEVKPAPIEVKPAPVEQKPAPVEQKKVAPKPVDISEINEPMELFCKMGLDAWFNPERLHPKVGDLVYWRDPKKSGIVFGSGLGILLSLSFFSLISVIAYLSLLALTGTICYRIYKNVLQAVQKTSDGHPFKDILELDLTLPQDKVREVTDIAVAHVNAAILELRRLFLVEDLVDSIKFGVLLWCLTYLGAWFNGMTLIIIAFVAMFTLPKVYENNKSQIDQNLDIVRAKLADISAKVKAAVPIGKKPVVEEKKEQ